MSKHKPSPQKIRHQSQFILLIILAILLIPALTTLRQAPVEKKQTPTPEPIIPVEPTLNDQVKPAAAKPSPPVLYQIPKAMVNPLQKGPFNVIKIKNVVIESEETINNQPTTVQVLIDEYIPDISEDITAGKKFPVILITHPTVTLSMAPARKQFDYLAEHLVSHGYIVITYEWSGDMGQCEIVKNAERESSIVKLLEKRNTESDSALFNLVDLNNIGLIGHSNGAFAQHFAKTEPRVKAFIGLSGFLCEWGGLYRTIVDLQKPFMYIGASKDQLRGETKRLEFYGLWDLHTGPKIMFDIKDGDHWQFTDDYVYFPDVVLHYARTDNIFKNLYRICQAELNDSDPANDAHCQDEYVSRTTQHDIVKYFATAFFEVYLKNNDTLKTTLKNPEINELITNFKYDNID